MTEEGRDRPDVIIFPPLVPLAVLVVGGLLDWLAPLPVLNRAGSVFGIIVGALLFGIGVALVVSGDRAFKRVGTNVNPLRPSLAVATGGIFAHMRNPMYVGMIAGLLGIVLAFSLEWTLVLTIVAAFVLHYGVVLREERYLERKFGDEYRRYKDSVPRYGWKR